jgi:hypothetical protein
VAAWADRSAVVPVDLETLGDQATLDACLPLVVGVDRPDQVDLVLVRLASTLAART